MCSGKRPEVELELKVMAFVLMAGGLLGIPFGLTAEIRMLLGMWSPLTAVFVGLSVLLYGWCLWTGVELWQGRPQGCKWAKVLFIAQTPNVTVSGLTYAFQTLGLTVRFLLRQSGPMNDFGVGASMGISVARVLQFSLGSSIRIYISPSIGDAAVGVNLVAVFALICLFRLTSPAYARSKDRFGLI